jgi:hypothetical protein
MAAIKVATKEEIAFVKNTSEGISIVAKGIDWQWGDRIVTTAVEYPANIYPWMEVVRGHGCNLVMIAEETDATTGAYSFTLSKPLDHPTLNGAAGDNTENNLTIDLSSIIQATDKDGDSVAAAAGGLVMTVNDDTPAPSTSQVTATVDEDGRAGDVAGGGRK